MEIPVFLSYAKPFNRKQAKFISKVEAHLSENGFNPRTLGITDYSLSAPLMKIKEIMDECYGLLSIAFRRAHIEKGTGKLGTNLTDQEEYDISGKWITSSYCQIEPSMAFQIDMPILIFRERGVIDDGILERGVVGSYMPEFDLDSSIDRYFKSREWNQLINEWKNLVLDYKRFDQFKKNEFVRHIISCCICEKKEVSFASLYDDFQKSINDGWIEYNRLVNLIGVDDQFESRYRIYNHSFQSDVITICQDIFETT